MHTCIRTREETTSNLEVGHLSRSAILGVLVASKLLHITRMDMLTYEYAYCMHFMAATLDYSIAHSTYAYAHLYAFAYANPRWIPWCRLSLLLL